MAYISPTALKNGQRILIDGEPYTVVESAQSAMGRGRGRVVAKLKHIVNGNTLERTFRSTDNIELADAEFRDAQYLYRENDFYIFMDTESYEQYRAPEDVVGDAAHFLKEGITVTVTIFEGQMIDLELPLKMDFEVVSTIDAVKGNTATNVTKEAEIDTGYVVKVPLFIKEGDRVRINTQTEEYVERC